MIDISVSYYSNGLYKFKYEGEYEPDCSHMISLEELRRLQQDLKDALWLVNGFLKPIGK